MKKVIVAGYRNYHNKDYVYDKLDEILKSYSPCEILEGGASGVDALAKQYAIDNSIPYKEYPANWNLYGRSAGVLRNQEMARNGDVLIAFYNGSIGTANMIKEAKSRGLKVHIVKI